MLILQKFICKHDYKTILMIIRPMSSVTIGVRDKMSDVNIMDKMNGHVRDGMRIRLGRISVKISNYLTSKYDDLHIFKFQMENKITKIHNDTHAFHSHHSLLFRMLDLLSLKPHIATKSVAVLL